MGSFDGVSTRQAPIYPQCMEVEQLNSVHQLQEMVSFLKYGELLIRLEVWLCISESDRDINYRQALDI